MRKRHLLTAVLLWLATCAADAQKKIFVPEDLQGMDLMCDTSRWSYARSAQTEDLVFFWEKGFGFDYQNPPALEGKPMRFDLDNLKRRVQSFYRFFRDTLKFSLPGSKADRYKMMVMVNYSLDGTAYGGTYDNFIGALWVAPNRIQDKKLNCLAHELGHSFQLQIPADSVGDAWGGTGFFEMTSQWMLWQVNPDWVKDEQYHFDAFRNLTHKAYLHMTNIYHSPYVIEWWAEQRGRTTIAELYRQGRKGEDPVMTYKRMWKLTQPQFCDEMFRGYQHLVDFDFTHARPETRPYACTFSTPLDTLKGGWLRPKADRTVENYGFNAIRLSVPQPGKKVSVQFRGLSVDRNAGWRYGFVGVTQDDRCIYGDAKSARKGLLTFQAPADTPLRALYLVVMGAPQEHRMNPMPNWEKPEKSPKDASYPYEIRVK